MVRRSVVVILGLIAACATACLEETTCVLERGELTRIRCPGGTVETEDELPEGATCIEVEGGVACDSGDEYMFPDAERSNVEDGASEEDRSVADPVPGFPGGSSGPTGQDGYDCTVVGERIDCTDGGSIPAVEVPAPDRDTCRSVNVPGVGRRVVCGDAYFAPTDEEGQPVDGAEPSCSTTEISASETIFSCSDGTSVVVTSSRLAECELEEASVTLESNGDIVLRCGDFEERVPETGRCVFPGGLVVDSRADADEFLMRGCRIVYGDVSVQKLQGLSFLSEVDAISGMITVEDNPGMREVDELEDGLRLFEVGGLTVMNNRDLVSIDELDELKRIDGELVITGNKTLKDIGMNLKHVGSSIIVASNEELTFFAEPDLDDELPLFMFIENTAFPWCELDRLWIWSSENAGTAYIGGTSAERADCD